MDSLRSFARPLALAALASLAAPAVHADGGAPTPPPAPRYDTHFSAGDWFASILIGDSAALVGGGVGLGLGMAVAPCDGECAILKGVGGLAGATVFSTAAGSAAIYGYGELTGHSGNYWATLGGWAVGLAGAAGIASIDDSGVSALDWVALGILPALGATAGYVLTLDDGGSGPPPTGALLEVDHGVRLAPPNVSIGLDARGDIDRVDVTLLGGRF